MRPEYDYTMDVVNYLKNKKSYPEKSIVLNYWDNSRRYDIILVENVSRKVIWTIEIKILENENEFQNFWNHSDKFYDELVRYYDGLELWVSVYLFLGDGNWNRRYFVVVNHKLFEDDYYLEMKDFSSYRELSGSTFTEVQEEEQKDTNNNYRYFRISCWIVSGFSFLLFLYSLRQCEIISSFRWPVRQCSLRLDYPNIIVFVIWIILLLMSFLRKIKTQWFSIDWGEEEKNVG